MSGAVAVPPRDAGARHFAWRYSHAAARDGTAALLTIEHEVMSSVRAGLDHTVAHARLAWWQQECERLAAAQPAHPATRAVRDAFLAARLAPPDLAALPVVAASVLAHAAQAQPLEPDEVAANAARWAGALFLPLARLALATATQPHDGGDTGGHRRAPAAGSPSLEAVGTLGAALHRHEASPDAASRRALRDALRALPAPLAGALCGLVVWCTLALSAPEEQARISITEDWRAWRAARRALRARP